MRYESRLHLVLLCYVFSSIGLYYSIGIATILFSPLSWATLIYAICHLAWIFHLVLSVLWIRNRKASAIWPILGCVLGIVSLLFTPLRTLAKEGVRDAMSVLGVELLTVFPCVILGFYLTWFHLFHKESACDAG